MVWPPIASGRCLLRGRADCRRGLFGGRLTARPVGYGWGGGSTGGTSKHQPYCWMRARCARRHVGARARTGCGPGARVPGPQGAAAANICIPVTTLYHCSRTYAVFCSFPNHQVPRALSFPIIATTAAALVVDLYILPTMVAVPMLWFIIATPNPHP